jgi:hypothetical protein
MKRLLLSLALLGAAAAPALAQSTAIPNGGFETWTGTAPAEKPQNWQTTDDLIMDAFGVALTSNTVSKVADVRTGSSAVRLETKAVSVMGLPLVFPGLVILGNRLVTSTNPSTNTDGAGLPFTNRPEFLQCYYKLTGSNLARDSASVGVFLTRTVGGQSVIIAEGNTYLRQEALNYTLLQVPLQYSSNLAPDSIHILAFSGKLDGPNLTVGNTLLLDDISTVGTATAARDARRNAELTAFPNPSADGLFTLAATADAALLSAPLTVTDALGRTVLSQPAQPRAARRQLDLRGRPAGVYTVQLTTAAGPVTRRLVVR